MIAVIDLYELFLFLTIVVCKVPLSYLARFVVVIDVTRWRYQRRQRHSAMIPG